METPFNTQSSFSLGYLILAGTLAFYMANNEPTLLPSSFYESEAYSSHDFIEYPKLPFEYTLNATVESQEQYDVEPLVTFPTLARLKVRIKNVSPLEFTSIEDKDGFI